MYPYYNAMQPLIQVLLMVIRDSLVILIPLGGAYMVYNLCFLPNEKTINFPEFLLLFAKVFILFPFMLLIWVILSLWQGLLWVAAFLTFWLHLPKLNRLIVRRTWLYKERHEIEPDYESERNLTDEITNQIAELDAQPLPEAKAPYNFLWAESDQRLIEAIKTVEATNTIAAGESK